METSIDKSSPVILGKRCEFHEPFGMGGTGTVFRANDLLTGNEVARKQMTVPTEPLLFSGRLVPGQGPTNAEYADKQMNFGFSTGALKPKRPFLLEPGVDPDAIFRSTRRRGKRRREAEEKNAASGDFTDQRRYWRGKRRIERWEI